MLMTKIKTYLQQQKLSKSYRRSILSPYFRLSTIVEIIQVLQTIMDITLLMKIYNSRNYPSPIDPSSHAPISLHLQQQKLSKSYRLRYFQVEFVAIYNSRNYPSPIDDDILDFKNLYLQQQKLSKSYRQRKASERPRQSTIVEIIQVLQTLYYANIIVIS